MGRPRRGCVDGVEAAVLEGVGAEFVDQSDSTAFVTTQVDDDDTAGGTDEAQRGVELVAGRGAPQPDSTRNPPIDADMRPARHERGDASRSPCTRQARVAARTGQLQRLVGCPFRAENGVVVARRRRPPSFLPRLGPADPPRLLGARSPRICLAIALLVCGVMLASIPFVTSSRAAVTFVVTRYGIGAAHPGVVCVPNPAQDPTSAASLRSQRLASRPWIRSAASATMRPTRSATGGTSWMRPCDIPADQMPASGSPCS